MATTAADGGGERVKATLYTASWWALWEASKAAPLPVQPVRTSRGKPRFWPAAASFPAIDELMPDGWMLGITDPERFGRAYRQKLHRIGLPTIEARLAAITVLSGQPLALLCFERDRADCHRGQFAAWYERKTGMTVPELSLVTSLDRERVALMVEVEPVGDLAKTQTSPFWQHSRGGTVHLDGVIDEAVLP
jgi:hypothetical protein